MWECIIYFSIVFGSNEDIDFHIGELLTTKFSVFIFKIKFSSIEKNKLGRKQGGNFI